MMYFLAIILPPVAVLFAGKPFQALLNLILCLFLYIPGVVHAILVVNEKKNKGLMKEYGRKNNN